MAPPHPKWCSLRLRFAPEEVALVKGAETVYGDALGHSADATALRQALSLMKTCQKIAASAGSPVSLSEAEVSLLLSAIRATHDRLERYHDDVLRWQAHEPLSPDEATVLEHAFPVIKGSAWETSRVMRRLQELRRRLEAPLR